jgi:hypothetical protein
MQRALRFAFVIAVACTEPNPDHIPGPGAFDVPVGGAAPSTSQPTSPSSSPSSPSGDSENPDPSPSQPDLAQAPPDLAAAVVCRLDAKMNLTNLDGSPPTAGTACGTCLSTECASLVAACLNDPDVSGNEHIKLGCAAYAACLASDYAAHGDLDRAKNKCGDKATSSAVAKWQAATLCGHDHCL